MATLTVYPDANPETNTVDGDVIRSGVDEVFSTLITSTGNSINDDGSSARVLVRSSAVQDQFSNIANGFALFDTSALGSGASISGATVSFTCSLAENSLGSTDLVVVSSNPASNTGLANGDLTSVGSTSFGSLAFASWVADSSTYNVITLNASGIINISKTGISKFGMVLEWVRAGTFGGTWASTVNTRYFLQTAENGTSLAPKLVITYTTGGGTSTYISNLAFMGAG